MSNILEKKEDPKSYAKLANKGMMVAHPVSIGGKHKRADNGIHYHATVKFFDTDKDKPEQAHKVAQHLKMTPPDPHKTTIHPEKFKAKDGSDVYVLHLKGPHADEMKEHHKKFAHMGHKEPYEFKSHISVDHSTWKKIKESKAKTAHEAGIEFHPAELKQGSKTLHTYHDKIKKSEAFLDSDSIKETIFLDVNLNSQHSKVLLLNEEQLNNYLEDNKSLKKSIEEVNFKRIELHFNDNNFLKNIALEKGIKEAYKVKGK